MKIIVYRSLILMLLGLNISSVFAVTLNPPITDMAMIKGVINEKITAADMAGMQITVNGVSNATWDGNSAVSTDGWSLGFIGTDTIRGFWQFINTGLPKVNTVVLDAFIANTVFDTVSGSEGTEGSFDGNFDYSGPADVEFLGPVKLASSSAPEGDLFRGIEFDFSGAGGLSQDQSFIFIIDSDQFTPVPLPPAFLLFISGLVGFVGIKHKKN